MLLTASSDTSNPKSCTEQILAIAPILPGSGKGSVGASPETTAGKGKETAAPPPAAQAAPASLIDFDSRPPSTAPPEPKIDAQAQNKAAAEHNNILHPTSDPQPTGAVHQSTATQAPAGNAKPGEGNLLDMDDDVHQTTNEMSNLNMSHQAMQPRSPLQRTDTGTSEVDVFVDAEEK
jgi:hypothetical protein